MIQIRNVTKVYRPKKGVPVKALDDVSLDFPEKGMIFILGKSGSGKSTLLNVLGGLDAYDSGEFIIKGKSSKDFKQSDFDAYRNTFIGFIFQEYNVLNEFTVGANIALAMQLQGKKVTDETLNRILDDVDLTGYGSRKPNELSGGQKQRVAIARALIKDPEIIMADEPTGALDSNTGKQVFDTLKKLSKDKLVIVVSHDREFAEYYGDRVIELADGKIISDITKFQSEPETVADGLRMLGDSVIEIKRGYRLTPDDLDLINEYLAQNETTAFLSVDAKANGDFRRAARITDEGRKECFRDTRDEDVPRGAAGEFRLVRGRLPFRHSFRIGASSLKVKPFRLFMTILLSCIAFALFGLADTMAAYNKVDALTTSMLDTGTSAAVFGKKQRIDYGDYESIEQVALQKSDLDLIREKTGIEMQTVERFGMSYYDGISLEPNLGDSIKLFPRTASGAYYTSKIFGAYAVDDDAFSRLGFELTGSLPKTKDEIVVTQYLYRHFLYAGYRSVDGEVSEIKLPQDLIGKTLRLSGGMLNGVFKVVGIVDTHDDPSLYSAHLPGAAEEEDGLRAMMIATKMETYTTYGFHSIMFAAPAMIASAGETRTFGKRVNNADFTLLPHEGEVNRYFEFAAKASEYGNEDIAYRDGMRDSLSGNEILLSVYELFASGKQFDFSNISYQRINYYGGRDYQIADDIMFPEWDCEKTLHEVSDLFLDAAVIDYVLSCELPEELKADALAYFEKTSPQIYKDVGAEDLSDAELRFYYAQYLKNGVYYLDGSSRECDPGFGAGFRNNRYGDLAGWQLQNAWWKKILEKRPELIDLPAQLDFDFINYNTHLAMRAITLDVKGIYLPNPDTSRLEEGDYVHIENGVLLSDTLYDLVELDAPAPIWFAIGQMPKSRSALKNAAKFNYNLQGDFIFPLYNEPAVVLENINSMVETLADVFLYIGLGFAVFAALMLMNFIATSISYKKREIGILRAVGAKSSDVFGIFFNESLIIAVVNFIISVALVIGTTIGLNAYLLKQSGFAITILMFGIRQIALMLGVSILVAFVASFLPVYRIARKRPIDAINNR